MKVDLLGVGQDWIMPWKMSALQQSTFDDLEMQPIITVAASKDQYVADLLIRSLFNPLDGRAALEYRQNTLKYALKHVRYFTDLYHLTSVALDAVRERSWIFGHETASASLTSTIAVTQILLDYIAKIMELNIVPEDLPTSMINFEQRMLTVFGGGQLKKMQDLLSDLERNRVYGVEGKLDVNFGSGVGEREIEHSNQIWNKISEQLKVGKRKSSFEIPARDDNATNALERIENRATFESAKTMLQIYQGLSFFVNELKAESGWLVGMAQLQQNVENEVCYPGYGESIHGTNLKNVVLLLDSKINQVVGNNITMKKSGVTVITGANQGGKTTFLRGIGQATLMAEAGMFVFGDDFTLPMFTQVITHFKREEDQSVASGKLDEELKRMRTIVQNIKNDDLILMNESFSSTNEHEGSLINYEITKGLVGRKATVITVSHQYEYTQLLKGDSQLETQFMRAQRDENGSRPFRVVVGEPLPTSYGLDIFEEKFKKSDQM